MSFKRTESETREYLAALKDILGARKECLCFTCASECATLVAVIDTLSWLLGERGTEEFYEVEGQEADFDFHFVQNVLARHRLGEFEPKHHKGTGR